MKNANAIGAGPPFDMRPLERGGAVPLYHQLFLDLRRRIDEGAWTPGGPFPREAEIGAAYGVSRITVRQAVGRLVDGGLVARFRGRGSFVTVRARGEGVRNHRLVRDEIAAMGMEPTVRGLGPAATRVVCARTAERLHGAAGETALALDRLHLADGAPFCLESILLLEGRHPDVFRGVAEGERTLREAYRRLGIEVARSEQTVGIDLRPSPELRRHLGLPPEMPALVVERVGHGGRGEPVDLRRMHYRADRFELRQEIVWP